MATAGTLIDETLNLLYSGTREQLNTLASAVSDTTSTSLTFTYDLRGIQTGSLISVDLEVMYVVATSGSAATVIRGYAGSTAATHLSGATVTVNPKFSRYRVLQELNHELGSLSSPEKGLFAPKTVDLTYQSTFQGYDLTGVTSLEKILAVRAQRNGADRGWDTLGRDQIELQRDHDTDNFASGFSLQLLRGDPGRTVQVVYAAGFGSLSAESTDPNAAAVGLPSSANDIPPLGAALRLAYPREVSRNFHETQGEPRRGEEVPPGANVNAGVGIARLYEQRVKEEASRLARRYPLRRYA